MPLPKAEIAGRCLQGIVATVLVLAGLLKLVGVGAEDMLEGLAKAHLLQHQSLISWTAIACGVLLAIPYTRKLGWLLSTAYWGGAIVAHLTYDDSVLMPAAFQALLWAGIWLEQRARWSPANSPVTE